MEEDRYPDFGGRPVATNSNRQHIPVIEKTSAEMAVESIEDTRVLNDTEDIEVQHSEASNLVASLPSENVMPGRNSADIARDTKRILEIAYGSENGGEVKSSSTDNTEESSDTEEDGNENEKFKLKEGQFIINGYIINPLPKKKKTTTKKKTTAKKKKVGEKTKTKSKKTTKKKTTAKKKKVGEKTKTKSKKTTKKKTKKKKKESTDTEVVNATSKDGVSESSQVANTCDSNSESESLLKTIVENSDTLAPIEQSNETNQEGGKKKGKGKGKKKKKKKKKKATEKGVKRDAAGRIIRKRKKVKHRYKVVKKHLIKNGKDAKISLDPIIEADEDMDSSYCSRLTLGSLQGSLKKSDHSVSNGGQEPLDGTKDIDIESSRAETDHDSNSDDSYMSSASSGSYYDDDELEWICFTRKGIAVITCLILLSVGLGIGLTYIFLLSDDSAPSPPITVPAPPTAAPSRKTSSPTAVLLAPTVFLPTGMPTTTVPTASNVPSASPTTAAPTVTPVPTDGITTLTPTVDRIDYLKELVETISPDHIQLGTPQAKAFEWMTTQDLMIWSKLQDREVLERYILVTFYYMMRGNEWNRNTDWLSEVHICDWYGLECNLDIFVMDIVLEDNRLVGTLPTELSGLLDLEGISLDLNVVQGAIPSEFGQLTRLTDLSLSSTTNLNFQGSLPTEIGMMTSLQRLRMRSNGLTGMIPTEIGLLTMLTEIELSQNELTGSILPEMGLLESLRFIDLSWNLFNGNIPNTLFNLTQLISLDLDINYLNGTLSQEVVKLSNLEILSIAGNSLTGTLVTELSKMTTLRSLRLQNNAIEGTIPSDLGLLTNIQYLFLSSNEINGTIPSDLGKLSALVWLDLSKNQLTGTLPEEVKNLTSATIDIPTTVYP